MLTHKEVHIHTQKEKKNCLCDLTIWTNRKHNRFKVLEVFKIT